MVDMVDLHGHNPIGDLTPARVTLTTDHVTADAAGPLAAALHAAGVTVEHRTFLSGRGEEQHPSGVLLLATDGAPLPLAARERYPRISLRVPRR